MTSFLGLSNFIARNAIDLKQILKHQQNDFRRSSNLGRMPIHVFINEPILKWRSHYILKLQYPAAARNHPLIS